MRTACRLTQILQPGEVRCEVTRADSNQFADSGIRRVAFSWSPSLAMARASGGVIRSQPGSVHSEGPIDWFTPSKAESRGTHADCVSEGSWVGSA
jgi:hypothetical protein